MVLMRHVLKRDGIWWVRINIPADLQAEWGKTAEWRSLKTSDDLEAMQAAPAIIAEIKGRIAAMRLGNLPAPTPQTAVIAPIRLTPEQAISLIERWRNNQLEAAYVQAYNGELAPLDGDERALRSERMYALSQPSPWERIVGFHENHAAVIGVPLDHPALRHSRGLFADAWLDMEREIDRFRLGDFSRWTPKIAAEPALPKWDAKTDGKATGLKLSVLLERFIASKKPSEESDIRQVWRRLIEFIGDVEAASVSPSEADDWIIAVRELPVTRKPSVVALDMRAILRDHASERCLAPKTVWKWAGFAKRVFGWAESRKLIPFNPMNEAMPKKPTKRDRRKARRPYTPEEIGAMFSKPLFKGFAGGGDTGYREAPGPNLMKDAKYWLPIFALWHGCRLEEIGGAKIAEFKELDGIAYIDWTERKLKTPEASRELPIHPKMRELGFFDYVAERREAGDIHLFPELPHDPKDEEAGTRRFGKWWGYWSDANGFPDPNVDFHAFRHTFIRQCRGVIDEELRDLITGHVGIGGIGRDYGDGAAIKILFDALSTVKFPTFLG
jgi:integrase